jgi:hypothetical protein
MEILGNTYDKNIILDFQTDFNSEIDREECLKQFENETIEIITNPGENFETIRFMHEPYSGITTGITDLQCDIWYYFYFYNDLSPQTHDGGLDYSLIGITPNENAKMLKQATKGFFRLEFYKIPDGEEPSRSNRRLVFAKTLTVPLGERIFYTPLNEYIFVPIFVGNNYKNKENMYFFWFEDESALTEAILTGTTFYMAVRFFNSIDGSIVNFANKSLSPTETIEESSDLYYQVEIDRENKTYQVFYYEDGMQGLRKGLENDPIKFYEIFGG